METSSNNTFKTIFPKYVDLVKDEQFQTNDRIEIFIRNELPLQVEIVRKMESTFNSFLNQYTNLIVKRPQMANLSYSLASRATQLIDKQMKQYENRYQKLDKQSLNSIFGQLNTRRARELFRQQLRQLEADIRKKYIDNPYIARQSQEQVACTLYTLLEIYHYAKSDLVTAASKHQILDYKVASQAFKNQSVQPEEFSEFICLEDGFMDYINSIVNKRCRPFINKRDFFNAKIRQVLRQAESKVQPNLIIFLDSLISKEKHRIKKVMIPKIQGVLRNIGEVAEQKQCKEISQEVENLKRKFMQIKNNSYYIDLIRGNFNQKYKMELNKLENLYYLNNLQKYLQDVFEFMQNVLRVEQQILDNRKKFKNSLSVKVEDQLYAISNPDQSNTIQQRLDTLISVYFSKLKDLLYQIPENSEYNTVKEQQARTGISSKFNIQIQQRKIRQQQRNAQIKLRSEKQAEEKKKRQENMAEAKRRKQQQQARKRIQMQKKQQQRSIQMKAKMEQQAEQRKKRQQQRKRIDQQRKQRLREEEQKKKEKIQQQKAQKQRQRRKKEQQIAQRKKQDQKRSQIERIKRDQQAKKRKQQQQRKKKEEEQKRKIKDQEQLKRKQQIQQRKKQQQKIKLEKEKIERQRKQQQKKKKQQQQRKRKQDQQKKRKQKEAQQLIAKKEKQEADKKKRQQQQKKIEQQKIKRQEQARKKKQQQQRKRQQKQQQDRQKREQQNRKQQQRIKQEEKKKKEKQAQQLAAKKLKQQQQKKKRQEQQKIKLQKKKQQEQRQRKRKQQEQKEREKKKKEQQQQRKKKEEQKKRKDQQDRKRKQEQQRKKQQQLKKQQQKKRQQEKLRQQERKRRERQAQEAAALKIKQQQQKKKKQAVTKKNEPPKKSAINYGDYDEDDQMVDQSANIKVVPKQLQKPKKKQDDQYLQDYQDDFDDFSPQKQEDHEGQQNGEDMQIQPKRLIDLENVKCINQYVKGTSYARKNKPNLQTFNNKTQYIYLFQQLIQNRKLYIYETSISKAIYDFSKQMQDDSIDKQDLELTLSTIKQSIDEVYQKQFETTQIDPRTKLVFPFSFDNDINIYFIELNLYEKEFLVVLKESLGQDQASQNKFSFLVEAFMYLYNFEDPEVKDVLVPQQSKVVLDTFDKELPNLLLLFAMHYEQTFEPGMPIIINQYTIQRFFYISHVLQPLYKIIDEEGQKMSQFYNQMFEKFSEDEKIKIRCVQADASDPSYQSNITQSSIKIKQQFLSNSGMTHMLAMLQILILAQEEQQIYDKITFYFSMSRGGDKPLLNYYIISKDEDDQQNLTKMFEWVSNDLDDKFQTNVYMDFTRHNGLSEYSDETLPLWAHIIQKKKMIPLQAFRALTLGMTPYYVTYKQMD